MPYGIAMAEGLLNGLHTRGRMSCRPDPPIMATAFLEGLEGNHAHGVVVDQLRGTCSEKEPILDGRMKALKDLAVDFFGSIALAAVGLAVVSGVVVLFRGPEQGLPDFVWSLPELVYLIIGGVVVFGVWWTVDMAWRGLRTRGNSSPEDPSEDA